MRIRKSSPSDTSAAQTVHALTPGAPHLGEADLGIAGHLARARLAAQLRHDLVDLAQAGGAHRLAVRQAAAVGVDRQPAVDPRRARRVQVDLLAVLASRTRPDGSAPPALRVLHLDDVDLGRPDPATSNASRAPATVADGATRVPARAEHLDDPASLVRNATERSGPSAVEERAAALRWRRRVPPPLAGEHSMYCVSGWASIGEARISSAESGARRHACGVGEPFANALTATSTSVSRGIPCSCM